MFEKIGEKLSAMVAIPTVSGNRNRTDYHIGEYREYLQTAFPCLFAAAVPTLVGEALLLKIEGRGEKKLPVLFTGPHGCGACRRRLRLEVSAFFR